MGRRGRSLLVLLALLTPGTGSRGEVPKEKAKPPANPAQPEKNPYVERFQQLDANGDGYVSREEWPLEAAKFDVVDRNKDGRLSRSELLTPNVLRRPVWEEQFRELDRDRDGRLSRRESENGAGFDRQDRDRDGYVTLREYRAGLQDTWNARATLQDQRRFRNLDRNLDNRLTRLEFTGSRAVFDRLDRNRDGVLSPNEWQ